MITSQEALDILRHAVFDQTALEWRKEFLEAIQIGCKAITTLQDLAETWYVCT